MSPTREVVKRKRSSNKNQHMSGNSLGAQSSAGRRRKQDQAVYEDMDEDMRILTEAAEQHYAHSMSLEPRFPVTDPRKPCVCQHCGVGFAREKALASHARVSTYIRYFIYKGIIVVIILYYRFTEEILRLNAKLVVKCFGMQPCYVNIHEQNIKYNPVILNMNRKTVNILLYINIIFFFIILFILDESDMSDADSKFGDYYCNTCGMSFHRVDLLKRHARLHMSKKDISESDDGHMCNVCGETFREALDLLAHAEAHARYQPHR